MSISETHPEYNRGYLNDGRAGADPFVLFRTWLDEALHADYVVPTAMTLAWGAACLTASAKRT